MLFYYHYYHNFLINLNIKLNFNLKYFIFLLRSDLIGLPSHIIDILFISLVMLLTNYMYKQF